MRFRHSGRRRLFSIIAAVAVVGATATIAFAQSGTGPTKLAYSVSGKAAPAGPTTAAPGTTTFVVSTTSKEAGFYVVKLDEGADVEATRKAVDRELREDQIEALPLDLVGAASDMTKGRSSSFTIDLVAGTYLVLNTTNDKRTPSAVLTVSGERTTATAPRSTTIVSMFDYKFTLNRSLPRNGTIRVVNKGKRVHMMIALKAANRKGANALSKALRKGDRNAEKLIRGGGPSLDPVSPGANVQLPSVRYGKGSYVLACFWQSKQSKNKDHNSLGMTKVVTVK